jgi:hypothetical protein
MESGASEARFDELHAEAVDSLGSAEPLRGFTVVLIRSDLPALGERSASNVHIGGERINCTTGFVVKRISGPTLPTGVSTAGHCEDAQSDDGVSLTYMGGHVGTHGDFQWHTGPQGEPDDFYAGSASAVEVDRRDVAAVGAPVVGQALCKNGYAGFKDCDNVDKLGVCDLNACNLVQTELHFLIMGDSGGPFYWANTAYGLSTGWHFDPIPPFARDLFSRADRIDNALNVNILTCCT